MIKLSEVAQLVKKTVIIGFITLVLLEFVFYFIFQNEFYNIYSEKNSRYIYLAEYPPNSKISYNFIDRTGFYRFKNNQALVDLETDDHGFIKPSFIHPTSDLTIFFLGGSTTECLLVPPEKRFPYLVGRKLENRFSLKTNSINCGKKGANSLNSSSILLNKVIPYHPQYVLIMHNCNDLGTLLRSAEYQWDENSLTKSVVSVFHVADEQLSIPRNIRQLLISLFPRTYYKLATVKNMLLSKNKADTDVSRFSKNSIKDDSAWIEICEKYRKSITTLLAICKTNEIVPIVLTQFRNLPEKSDIADDIWAKFNAINYSCLRKYHKEFNSILRDICQEQSISCIDLENLVPQSWDYFYDWVHVNEEGSVLVSDIIAKAFADLRIIEQSNSSLH